jgi:protein O-mannosyl-transferase
VTEDRRARGLAGSILVVALLAVLPGLPSVRGDFVVDDVRFVKENRALEDPSILVRAFTDPSTVSGNRTGPDWHGIYRPLRTLDFALDRALGGGASWVFHVHGILWHVLASILSLLLLRQLLPGPWPPLLGAAVFALHPAQVESVAWITSRGDVMGGALALAVLLLALRGSTLTLVLSLLLFVPALLAKESAIVAPVLLVLILGRRSAAGPRRALLRAIPFVVIALVYFVARGLILSSAGDPGLGHRAAWWGGSWFGAWLTMARGVAHYAQILFVPTNLMFDYHVPQPESGAVPLDAVILLLAALALIVAATRSWWRGGRFGLGCLWILVALAPVSNVILTINIPTASRFLYLPMVGFALLVAGAISGLVRRAGASRRVPIIGAAVLVVLLGAISLDRAADWTSESAVWEPTLHDPETGRTHGTPTSTLAPYYFAYRAYEAGEAVLAAGGDPDVAAQRFEEAERLVAASNRAAVVFCGFSDDQPAPRGAYLRCLLALRLSDACGRDRWEEAITRAVTARIAAGPHYAPGYAIGGRICARLGLLEPAVARFEAAVSIAPDEPVHHQRLVLVLNRLALARVREERRESAVRALEALTRSLEIDPDPTTNADAHNLHRALAEDHARAVETASREAKDLGFAPEVSLSVARIEARFGRFEEAWKILERLEAGDPGSPELLVERTTLLLQLRGGEPELQKAEAIYMELDQEGRLPPFGSLERARCAERLARFALDDGRVGEARKHARLGLAALVRSSQTPDFTGLSLQGALFECLAKSSGLLGDAAEAGRAYSASDRALTRALGLKGDVSAPDRARAHRKLAKVLEALGQRKLAREQLQKVLEVLPKPPPDLPWLEYRIRRLAAR